MVSSIVLFTTLATLAASSVDALTVQAIQQGSNCLRVGNNPASGASVTSGSAVTLGECNNNNPLSATFTGQQWIITRGNNAGVTLYGTGLCLDAGSDTPDQNIVVNTCNGSPSQTWYATDDNRIAITGGTQCLEGEGEQATTGACAPGIDNQAFTYNLLFDTETATALVPGAIGTGVSRGLIPSASSSIASAINSLENSASSAVASLTSGAVASASSVTNSAQSAASAATASASSVIAGASSGVAGAASTASSGAAGAASTASSGVAGAASTASSGAAGAASTASSGAAGAASSASSGVAGAASSVTSGAAGAASSGVNGATSAGGGLVSSLQSVAATITSGAGAAASSITPGNAAVSDFHLSKVALLVSAVAIGAAMVV